MDLTQLANLGEFIGGVAVLVTLIYLVIQLRQNTQELQQTTEVARGTAELESPAILNHPRTRSGLNRRLSWTFSSFRGPR